MVKTKLMKEIDKLISWWVQTDRQTDRINDQPHHLKFIQNGMENFEEGFWIVKGYLYYKRSERIKLSKEDKHSEYLTEIRVYQQSEWFDLQNRRINMVSEANQWPISAEG